MKFLTVCFCFGRLNQFGKSFGQLVFLVTLFKFRFFFYFENVSEGLHVCLDCYYTEYPGKETAFLYLNLLLRFLVCVFFFPNTVICLLYIYSLISRPNSSRNSSKGSIFNKAAD